MTDRASSSKEQETKTLSRMETMGDSTDSRTAPTNEPIHTPGPWEVDYVVDGAFQVSSTVHGDRIVITSRAPIPHRHGEFVANAHLIAAAPDVLAALMALHDDIAEYAAINNLGGFDNHCMRQARAAIAKAEGR